MRKSMYYKYRLPANSEANCMSQAVFEGKEIRGQCFVFACMFLVFALTFRVFSLSERLEHGTFRRRCTSAIFDSDQLIYFVDFAYVKEVMLCSLVG